MTPEDGHVQVDVDDVVGVRVQAGPRLADGQDGGKQRGRSVRNEVGGEGDIPKQRQDELARSTSR